MKINTETATAELNKWLDFKNVKEKKRIEYATFGENIIETIESGNIILNEKNEIEYTLNSPILAESGAPVLSVLTFKPRLRVAELNAKLKGVNATDADARVMAYIAAATDQNTGLLSKMYTDDYSVCQSIIMYFL
jgi:hypothetical protein